jgi:hypothetical protein
MIKIYGTKIKDAPTETAEMITFFSWLRRVHPHLSAIAVHIRNEGKRTHGQVTRQKSEGLVTGAADIIIPGSPTFVCEMKRRASYKVSEKQIEYLEAAQNNGAFVCIALGYEGARLAVSDWIKKNVIVFDEKT